MHTQRFVIALTSLHQLKRPDSRIKILLLFTEQLLPVTASYQPWFTTASIRLVTLITASHWRQGLQSSTLYYYEEKYDNYQQASRRKGGKQVKP